jgi:hypothetical protein
MSRRLRIFTILHVIVVVDYDDDDGYENHGMMIIQHQPNRPKMDQLTIIILSIPPNQPFAVVGMKSWAVVAVQ